MTETKRILKSDPTLPYKTTRISAKRSKVDIEEILYKFGIKNVAWKWDPDNNKVELIFQLSRLFKDTDMTPTVRISPPFIWKKIGRYEDYEIDWNVSLRILHWYIKNALAWAYASQSTNITAFLPYIAVSETKTLKDVVPDQLTQFKALPDSNRPQTENILDV